MRTKRTQTVLGVKLVKLAFSWATEDRAFLVAPWEGSYGSTTRWTLYDRRISGGETITGHGSLREAVAEIKRRLAGEQRAPVTVSWANVKIAR